MKKSFFFYFVIFVLLLIFIISYARDVESPTFSPFIKNIGQTEKDILFYSFSSSRNLIIKENEIVLQELNKETNGIKNTYITFSHPLVFREGEPSLTYFNIFSSNDPQNWYINIPLFKSIEVYPINENELHFYIFFDVKGNLYLKGINRSRFNEIAYIRTKSQSKPAIKFFNEEHSIEDSSLSWSTYLGGIYDDLAYEMIRNEEGNLYIVGATKSSNIPVPNGYDQTFNSASDIYIGKLSSDGKNLLWASFIGGSSDDFGFSLTLDNNNDIIVGGMGSRDIPTPFGNQNDKVNQMYICKISKNGNNLIWGTKLGGGQVTSIKYSQSESSIVFLGVTRDTTLSCPNGFQQAHKGETDLYIGKLSNDSNLINATYLGGSSVDGTFFDPNTDYYRETTMAPKLILSSDNTIIIVTDSLSTSLPIVDGFQSVNKGNYDLYIAKLSSDCSLLLYSTYYGGSSRERVGAIKFDSEENLLVGGSTSSNDLWGINGYQKSSHGFSECFIIKTPNNFNQILWGTYLGGTREDLLKDLVLDGDNNVIITGFTDSSDFPLSQPYQSTKKGGRDVFISILTKDGSSLLESTYFGGNKDDIGFCLIFDGLNKIILSGITSSTDFPVKDGYDSDSNNSSSSVYYDIFISEMEISVLESCSIVCSPIVPTYAKPKETVQFISNAHTDPKNCSSLSYAWNFGDNSPITNEENPTHIYSQEGVYLWSLFVSGKNIQPYSKSGKITITNSDCRINCEVVVPQKGIKNIPVKFSATVSLNNCSQKETYLWDFGDGTTSSEKEPFHTYTSSGLFHYKFSVNADSITCEKEGTIEILNERPCLKIGGLAFCANEITNEGSKYRLSQNVSLNDILFFDGDVTIEIFGNYNGKLFTDSNIFFINGFEEAEILVEGPNLQYTFNGLEMRLIPSFSPLYYHLKLAQVPLYINGTEIVIDSEGVKIYPFIELGAGNLIIARSQLELTIYPHVGLYLTKVDVIEGSLTPSITVASLSLSYDDQNDLLSGSIQIGFPFLEMPSVEATVKIKSGCFNGFSISIGLPVGIPIGQTGLEIVGFVLEVDNLCEVTKFYIFIGGDIGIVEVPDEIIALKHMGLGYQVPYTLIIDAGTLSIFGYSLARAGGNITVNPPFILVFGEYDIASIYTGTLTITFDIPNQLITGNARGSVQIPDFYCCEYCFWCMALKAILNSICGSLPYTISETTLEVKGGKIKDNKWGSYLKGSSKFEDYVIAFEIKIIDGDLDFSIGTNFDNLFEIWEVKKPAEKDSLYEKSIEIQTKKKKVIFVASSRTVLPNVYLVTPTNEKITKENYSSFNNIKYFESLPNMSTFFEVSDINEGIWKFGVTNFTQDEGELFAFSEHPEVSVTFSSVTPFDGGYIINLNVEPIDPQISVDLFYSDSPNFGNGLVIENNKKADDGNYTFIWNTQKVKNGNYMIFAKVSDGKNKDKVVYYENLISVNKDSISPPTNLRGTRNSDKVYLSWDPSPSNGVCGYEVLYTDEPEIYGYKFKTCAFTNSDVLISNLDIKKTYRFAVVAFTNDGRFSLESNSLTLKSVDPPSIISMKKLSNPFRILVDGSNLQEGIRIFIDNVEWTNIKWISTSSIKIKGGSSLKALVPKGKDVTFKFLNPDGGEATYIFKY